MKHPVKYNNLKLRVLGSLLAANFVVLYGVELTLYDALHKPGYHLALVVSFTIALCLTYLVHLATVRLDRLYSWSDNLSVRVVFQFLLGFASPALCAVVFAWIYFAIMGVDIVETGYFRMDYPIIVLMLLAFNMYYIIHYLIARMRKRPHLIGLTSTDHTVQSIKMVAEGILESGDTEPSDEALMVDTMDTEGPSDSHLLTVHSGLQTLTIDPDREVCFFYRATRKNWLVTFSGDAYLISKSMFDCEQSYTDRFFRINRKVLVNAAAIAGYADGSSRTIVLTLLPEYAHLAKDNSFVSVSQKSAVAFKAWFDG